MADPVSAEEVARHAAPDNCWVVIDGTVWDLTEFAPTHPGGADGMYVSLVRYSVGLVGWYHAPPSWLSRDERWTALGAPSLGYSLLVFIRPRITRPRPPLESNVLIHLSSYLHPRWPRRHVDVQ